MFHAKNQDWLNMLKSIDKQLAKIPADVAVRLGLYDRRREHLKTMAR